ncbi:MAG: Uma2 family endonuclease [Candidatus Xenobiia bacterium LiM19]
MKPAPSTTHQRILGALFTEFSVHLRGHKCEAFMAPFDVRLPSCEKDDTDIITWVQPDRVIVCDPSKIDERGCKGAPDLIVEILSPATARKDMKEKLILYKTVGVSEY